MTDRIWHKGPPPHVGWWNASAFQDPYVWRWWNGSEWSGAAWAFMEAERAASATNIKQSEEKTIEWTDYWPKNARVPRVDPRQQQEVPSIASLLRKRLVETEAAKLIEFATRQGLVVTISRRPLQPLAMGNAEYVVETWPVLRRES